MGDAVGDGAAGHPADVEGQLVPIVGQVGDAADGVGQLDDSVGPLFVGAAGVGSPALDGDVVDGHALAGDDGGVGAVFGEAAFVDQAGQGVAGQPPQAEVLKVEGVSFFRGVDQNDPGDGVVGLGGNRLQGGEGHIDSCGAALAVDGARAVAAVAFPAPAKVVGRLLFRREDGVEVRYQSDLGGVRRRGPGGPGQDQVAAVGRVGRRHLLDGEAEIGKGGGGEVAHGVDAGRVGGVAVDRDHLAQEVEIRRQVGLEIGGQLLMDVVAMDSHLPSLSCCYWCSPR